MRRMVPLLALLLCLCACDGQTAPAQSRSQREPVGQMALDYATGFQVDYYEDGLALLTIHGEGQFLLIPEGETVPEDAGDITPVTVPCENLYLAASSPMDLFRALGALDSVAVTSTRAEDWTIEGISERLSDGRLTYAGKYSAPDYELVLSARCPLAIESTMIYHKPQVKEQLEALGVPVLVERSSYEDHPLGRLEWIKLYGLLTGHLDEAEAIFRAQSEAVARLNTAQEGGPRVAFFYVTAKGAVNVRCPGDYVSNMIVLAGGTYLFQPGDLSVGDDARSTMNLQMEEFYTAAKDADILIYNSTVGGEISTVEELLALSPLFADFKAVQERQVWCTGQNLFQQTSAVADTIQDFHTVFTGGDPDSLHYLHPVS